jgi:hypothetical protein
MSKEKRHGTCYLHITVEDRMWREDYSEPLSDTIASESLVLLGDTDNAAIRALIDRLRAVVAEHDQPRGSHLEPVP